MKTFILQMNAKLHLDSWIGTVDNFPLLLTRKLYQLY